MYTLNRVLRTLIGIGIGLICFCSPSFAANVAKTALIVGNSDYPQAPLLNPSSDASDMSEALKLLGFDVISATNLNRAEMLKAIRAFTKRLDEQQSVGFFYYAGHGVQIDNTNYLLPISTNLEEEESVLSEGIDINWILHQMKQSNTSMNILMLDACRNNPFNEKYRSISRGLSRMQDPSGSFIAFATAPGRVAEDGDDNNGLYTKYFLQYVMEPGLSIEQIFKQVRNQVEKESKGKQIPWESSSLKGDFYFIDKLTITPGEIQEDQALWQTLKNSDSIDDYQTFIQDYPNSVFVASAKLRIHQINRIQSMPKAETSAQLQDWITQAHNYLTPFDLTESNLASAQRFFDMANLQDPEDARVETLKRNLVSAYVNFSETKLKTRELDKASTNIQKAKALSPEDAQVNKLIRRIEKQNQKLQAVVPGI